MIIAVVAVAAVAVVVAVVALAVGVLHKVASSSCANSALEQVNNWSVSSEIRLWTQKKWKNCLGPCTCSYQKIVTDAYLGRMSSQPSINLGGVLDAAVDC